jgi:hypothetical protein
MDSTRHQKGVRGHREQYITRPFSIAATPNAHRGRVRIFITRVLTQERLWLDVTDGLQRCRGVGLSPLASPFEAALVVIYTFASSKTPGLFAFSADRRGRYLPDRHGPWTYTGRIQPDERLPYELDRTRVEEALGDTGFQMWRRKRGS